MIKYKIELGETLQTKDDLQFKRVNTGSVEYLGIGGRFSSPEFIEITGKFNTVYDALPGEGTCISTIGWVIYIIREKNDVYVKVIKR